MLGPSAYLQPSDSPFASVAFSYFHLENFETGGLTVPGVTLTPGWSVLSPGSLTDSVDSDDGTVDGSGTAGHSLYSAGNFVLTVTFNAIALGGLPTHAGIVETDVGFTTDGGLGVEAVVFSAYDALNNLIGTTGSPAYGDGQAGGQTAEDRFYGVFHAGGISRIVIEMPKSNDWEVDHLQYGLAEPSSVPEPSTFALLGAGLLTAGIASRRRFR